MNGELYAKMLEPDTTVNEDTDYCFAMGSTEGVELLCNPDDEMSKWTESEIHVDEKNIILNRFTECFTIGMVARLSNQLHIDEEELKIESDKDDYKQA